MLRTISDYIVDLTQNSVDAGSSVIIVDLLERDGRVKVYIADNGAGMDAQTLARIREYLPESKKNAPVCTCAPISAGDAPARSGGRGIPYLAVFIANCGGD